eukprot:2958065-Prymnesium_polylepis.1
MLSILGASVAYSPSTWGGVSNNLPTVTAHGMGDSCFNSGELSASPAPRGPRGPAPRDVARTPSCGTARRFVSAAAPTTRRGD